MEMHIKFCSENLQRGDYSEDLGIDEEIIREWILGKEDVGVKVWTGFIWLRIGTSGGLLRTQ
jgi:hypothetical protein